MAISFSPAAKVVAQEEKAKKSKTPVMDKLREFAATNAPLPLYVRSRGSGSTYRVLSVDKHFNMKLVPSEKSSPGKEQRLYKFDCRYAGMIENQFDASWGPPLPPEPVAPPEPVVEPAGVSDPAPTTDDRPPAPALPPDDY